MGWNLMLHLFLCRRTFIDYFHPAITVHLPLMNTELSISTPALLFPAVSLLFLSYTNRFLHLSALIRSLHQEWQRLHDQRLHGQIENLRKRLVMIRWMQLLGSASLLLSVLAMVSLAFGQQVMGEIAFVIALLLMAASLFVLIFEIWCSGGALHILLNQVEDEDEHSVSRSVDDRD